MVSHQPFKTCYLKISWSTTIKIVNHSIHIIFFQQTSQICRGDEEYWSSNVTLATCTWAKTNTITEALNGRVPLQMNFFIYVHMFHIIRWVIMTNFVTIVRRNFGKLAKSMLLMNPWILVQPHSSQISIAQRHKNKQWRIFFSSTLYRKEKYEAHWRLYEEKRHKKWRSYDKLAIRKLNIGQGTCAVSKFSYTYLERSLCCYKREVIHTHF